MIHCYEKIQKRKYIVKFEFTNNSSLKMIGHTSGCIEDKHSSKILFLQVKIHMIREKSNPNVWIHWCLSLPPVLYESAITKYHKLGGLKEQKLFFSQFWNLEVQNQVVGRVGFFWRLWGRIHSMPLC